MGYINDTNLSIDTTTVLKSLVSFLSGRPSLRVNVLTDRIDSGFGCEEVNGEQAFRKTITIAPDGKPAINVIITEDDGSGLSEMSVENYNLDQLLQMAVVKTVEGDYALLITKIIE